MLCPRCGYDLTHVNAPACPNCGLQLAQQPAQQPAYPPTGYPSAPSTPLYTPPAYQPAAEQPPNYGATPGYPQNPPAPSYPQNPPTYPGYGAPPSVPLGAPPNTPFGPGGYQQGYYGQPGMPSQQFASPPQKRGNGLAIGIIVAILVVLVGGGAAAISLSHGGGSTAAKGTPTVTSTTGPTATPTATVLYSQTFSSAPPDGDWSQDSNCFYGTGGYHVNDGYICFAPIGDQSDVTVSVDAKQISGDTTAPYGIDFRMTKDGVGYEFDVDSASEWVFAGCDATSCEPIVDFTHNSAIHGGLNTVNTLSVTAKGSHFDLFVNGTKVGQTDDTTYTTGLIGLTVSSGIESVFTNLVVTK